MPLLQAENQTDDIQGTIEALPGNEINADQIAEAIMQNMDDQQQQNSQHFISAGKELLFGKETHYQIMDNLKKSNDVVQDLGYGAYQLMITMIQSGGLSVQDRPDVSAVIIPSGVILMSLAAEFMNESKEFPDITLDQFGDAVEIFTHMMLKHDPEFNQEQEEVPDQQMQEQPQQSGALLNMGG
jgi:hypothetical protein